MITEIKGCDLPQEAKYMGIYLGNLSIEQMENRLGIKLTEDDKKQLWWRQPLAELKNKTDWHCFDIPFIITCGCMDTAIRINSVLSPYADQMKCQISIAIDNPKEAKQ